MPWCGYRVTDAQDVLAAGLGRAHGVDLIFSGTHRRRMIASTRSAVTG